MDILKRFFNIGRLHPGFYLYLGLEEYDKNTRTTYWYGPYTNQLSAYNGIPYYWQSSGLGHPKVEFRIFAPFACNDAL